MKKHIVGCIIILIVAIVFNSMVAPFISAYFQPDNIAIVNNQLSNDGIMSSASIQAGTLFDVIIIMIVNLTLLTLFGFFIYKICKYYFINKN